MTSRDYRCTLTVTIAADDETVKAAMLGFGLREGLDGPRVDDPTATFELQQQMLGMVGQQAPADTLQMYLVNALVVPGTPPLVAKIQRDLPGAVVKVEDIDVVAQ